METTITNTVTEPTTELAERDSSGKFQAFAGPGRPSKRLLELHARYKAETVNEVAALLAGDIPRLESELADLDREIAALEQKFLDGIAPTVKHRSEVAVMLSRARTAQAFLTDAAFGGLDTEQERARQALRDAADRLEAAERAFGENPEPHFTRAEALGDHDRWMSLHAFESARDELDEARRALALAVADAGRYGITLGDEMQNRYVTGFPFGADDDKQRTRQTTASMMEAF